MNFRFLHVIQLFPILVVVGLGAQGNSLIHLPNQVSHIPLLWGLSLTIFVSSLRVSTRWGRYLFLTSISVLFAYILNGIYESPTVGTLCCIIFALIFFKTSDFYANVKLRPPSLFLSALLTLLISLIPYGFVKYKLVLGTDPTLQLACSLSFAYPIIMFAKRQYIPRYILRMIPLVIMTFSTLFYVLKEPQGLMNINDGYFIVTIVLYFAFAIKHRLYNVDQFLNKAFLRPEIFVFSFFLFLSLLGTILLEIPYTRTNHGPTNLIDSFFTAVSAVCVTGLAVLDVSKDFNLFGQFILLGLIQLGGFGIVSMSSWAILILKSKRLSIHHEHALNELAAYKPVHGLKATISRIVIYFFTCEMIGIILLWIRFMKYDHSAIYALWRATFTSISAFCNAGLGLQSNSLIPYQNDFWILSTISCLIIAGGTAPLLVLDLPQKLWKRNLDLQEKLVISTTLGLLIAGFLFYTLVEWNQTLHGLTVFHKLSNGWFQSVTTRTAGFNSVDITLIKDVTGFFMILLMFIGGNPGGTAGGIKTVTFATLLIAGFTGLKGQDKPKVFNRKIPVFFIYKAFAAFLIASTMVFWAYFMLAVTQDIDTIPLFFETVSALGTVGLTIGATVQLDTIGKLIIALCMLGGRVGPLTFAYLFFKPKKQDRWDVSSEDIYIS